jgi:cytochrome P450
VSLDTFSGALFGTPKELIDDKDLLHEELELFPSMLLSNDAVATLIQEFNSHLQDILPREIRKLNRRGNLESDGVVIEMDKWMQRLMFECSGKTLFGATWPDDEHFFDDFRTWISGMYPLLKGYPRIFTRKAIQGRERYFKRLVDMFNRPLHNPSKVVVERMKVTQVSRLLTVD